MRLLVTIAARFYRGPDGHIYPHHPILAYNFFTRYLAVFDEVLVAARVWPLKGHPACDQPSDGPGVSFMGMPPSTGVFDLIRDWTRLRSIVRRAVATCDAYILRLPDFFGTLAYKEIRRRGLPFAVEVVGDPKDTLRAESVRHFLLPLIRFLAIRYLRQECSTASAVSYVTKHFLQKIFPPGEHTFATHYSSIDLPASLFINAPRRYSQPATLLVHVGTFDAFYKGPNVLVEALALLAERGMPFRLSFVGDGRRRPELEVIVKKLGLGDQVTFLGLLPAGAGVAAALDASHLFVLPSIQEGLPRAMIEAMARGVPCIGSTAGGIPELLPPEDLIPPGNALALADKILEVAQDPARMTAMSARNLGAAQEYRDEVLRQRRLIFYRQVRESAEGWRQKAK